MEQKISAKQKTIMLLAFFVFVALCITAVVFSYKSIRPIIFGACIAYLFKPMCNVLYDKILNLLGRNIKTRRIKLISHILSIVLTYIIWIIIISLIILLIVPQVIQSLITLVKALPDFVASVIAWSEYLINSETLNNYPPEIADAITPGLEQLYNDYFSTAKVTAYINSVVLYIRNATIGALIFTFDMIVGLIVSIYLLHGRKKFSAQSKMLLHGVFEPNFANIILNEFKFADKMFSGFFIGKLISSAILGVLCYIACFFMGTPSAMLVSVIIGVTNIIPFFGNYIGMVPACFIILMESPIHALTFLIMVLVLQQVDSNVLAPKIIGSSTGLSGFWVLFAILLFGGIFGFFGMIIGVPVFAVIYDVCGKLIRFCLKKRGEDEMIDTYEEEFIEEKEV